MHGQVKQSRKPRNKLINLNSPTKFSTPTCLLITTCRRKIIVLGIRTGLHAFIFFKKKDSLCSMYCEDRITKRNIQKERKGYSFYLLVHFPNVCSSQGWVRPTPGARGFFCVSHMQGSKHLDCLQLLSWAH